MVTEEVTEGVKLVVKAANGISSERNGDVNGVEGSRWQC